MPTTSYTTPSALARRISAQDALALLASLPTDNLEGEATVEDWQDAIDLAAGLDVPAATEHAGEMAEHLLDALRFGGGRVESILAPRYTAPILATGDIVPDEVESATISLARHHLFTRLGMTAPEGVREDYEDTMAWLMRVGTGKADIPSITQAETAIRRLRVITGEREYAESVQFYPGLF